MKIFFKNRVKCFYVESGQYERNKINDIEEKADFKDSHKNWKENIQDPQNSLDNDFS